jgi:geranyl-CoA carboxylase beta subunit
MHFNQTGLTEYLAQDDREAILMAREVVQYLKWDTPLSLKLDHAPPLYDPEELCGVVPVDYRTPYDVREIIARLVDGSEWNEFKSGYGPEIVCGWSEVYGYPVGIIGNQGPIFPNSSVKAAQFIQLCCQRNTPLVFLQNTTGFMVGQEAEEHGIVKHGSKMIQAVANASVPKITFLIGGAFGAGHYAMCGRAYDPRFIFAWPNSRIAVMGGPQIASVLRTITEEKWAKMGIEITPEKSQQIDQLGQMTVSQIDRESSALFATARLWDDGLIDPRDTRRILGEILSICETAKTTSVYPNQFGVARM